MSGRPDPLDAALKAAFDQGEPDGPECHLCGNQTGPWVPEPSGDRWPSGAQKLVCSGGCKTPWPEGAIARYLTVGGATVDATDTIWTCAGCDDTSRGKYTNPWGTPHPADEIKRQAQSHAETCRAMPKPGGAL